MPSAAVEARGLRPGSPVKGRVVVPGSKSIAQRALVCAALTGGTTRLSGLPDGEDVRAAIELVLAVHADVERLAPAALAIRGRPPGPHRGWNPTEGVDVGESGTLARLATASLALCGHAGRPFEVRARGTLLNRRSSALFSALRAAGVVIEREGWPTRVVPLGPPSEIEIESPASSQEVSALLVALAAYPDELRLVVKGEIPSRPYLEMTIGTLADFGVDVVRSRDARGEVFDVRGPLRAPEVPLAIEPDASAAAVALAAACLSGGSVTIAGVGERSRQGDARIVELLRAFGCDARRDAEGLHARGAPTNSASVDLEATPDLAPVVAIVAARAALDGHGPSHLTGLGTLPGKESSRIEVLAEGLRAVGFDTHATRDSLTIARSSSPSTRTGNTPVALLETAQIPADGVILDPHGDHRMAFAFALLGLCVDGVLVSDPECVAKSWPKFWSALSRAGAATAVLPRG